MKTNPLLRIAALCAAGILAIACSGGSNSGNYSYNGPGAAWSVDLDDDGGFEITAAATLSGDPFLTVEGT